MADDIVILRGQRFVITDCGVCGIVYTVPEKKHNCNRRLGGYSYCPNGHQWGWSEGTEVRDALRLERDRLKQNLAQKDDEIRAGRAATEAAERRAAAAKGQVTKLKKRASAGVCPCCTRSFQNLRQHMATKHPDFADSNVVEFKAEAS